MDGSAHRHRAYRFTALRINTLGCWLLLTPVMLWNAVVGMSALVVALCWVATRGVRSANAWAAAHAEGLPARAAAARGAWGRAAGVLVGAVALTALTAAALRQLSPLATLLGDPGVAGPVTGALAVILGGAIPGTVLVLASSPSTAMAGPAAAHDAPARPVSRAGEVGGRGLAALLAAALGVVNVAVLTSVTPLGEWVRGGPGQRAVSLAVLVLAFAGPVTAAWYARRVARQA
jgi:hypothetical protein